MTTSRVSASREDEGSPTWPGWNRNAQAPNSTDAPARAPWTHGDSGRPARAIHPNHNEDVPNPTQTARQKEKVIRHREEVLSEMVKRLRQTNEKLLAAVVWGMEATSLGEKEIKE